MEFGKSFFDDLINSDDVYEAIAICYCQLLCHLKKSEKTFLAEVGQYSNYTKSGYNRIIFEEFRTSAITSLLVIDNDLPSDGCEFNSNLNKLVALLKEFQRPDNLTLDDAISICMYYLLEALDSYVRKNMDLVIDTCRSYGPLNKGNSRDKCLIYLKERTSFLSGAYRDDSGGFRKPHRMTSIGRVFSTILIVQPKSMPIIPNIVPLQLSPWCKQKINEDKIIRITSIPYIGFDTFSFYMVNRGVVEAEKDISGLFYVDYCDKLDGENINRMVTLLQLAIDAGSHIIIFPEFIMSQKMVEAIKDYLMHLDYSKRKNLVMVFAGTHYSWNGIENSNNILSMFNANGVEIGQYYKYSPFLIQDREIIHGAVFPKEKLEDSSNICVTACEVLSHPGKICSIIDVEMIGRILPAICRDVIDDEITFPLVRIFEPTLLMIPSWSKSVHSFDSHLSSFANSVHTASLLCNCCNAVKDSDSDCVRIGSLFIPKKDRTAMCSELLGVVRNKGCVDLCRKKGGCIHQFEINFSHGIPEAKVNILYPT